MATKKEIFKEQLREWLRAKGDRKRRGEITKHVCFVTGMHKKSVPRAFRREQMRVVSGKRRSGRPTVFGPDVTAALKEIWEAANCPCGEILYPVIVEYVALLLRDGLWHHSTEATEKLLVAKEHTVRRRVTALRKKYRIGKGVGATKPSALKSIIPIFKGPWKDLPPGNGQLDTVAHCGDSLVGDFIYSVNYTDAATYWIVTRAQWNKGQKNTVENMVAIRERLPFPWKMAHPDTGSEFINWVAKEWFDAQGISFTRSEPGKKNDNMYVEERNGHVVRRYLGYTRLDNPDIVPLHNDLYDVLNRYLNHFLPVRRTLEKKRIGAKYHRVYEKRAKTPYERVLEHRAVSEEIKKELRAEHETLNPLLLKRNIDTLIQKILALQTGSHDTGRATHSG